MPPSRQECEFQLLQYVPNPVRNEFVHVGVILRGASQRSGSGMADVSSAGPVLAVKFTSDWRRVKCLDPEADTGMLEGLEAELRRRFAAETDAGAGLSAYLGGRRRLMEVLEDSFSNSVQVTEAKGYLAESVEAGVEELMRLYVETPRRERVSRLSGRAAIQLKMRTEFERVGVWDLLRKRIRAAEYTRAGDPLRLDLGYRSGAGEVGGAGEAVPVLVRMFQAVSLEAGAEAAKGLAFSVAALRAGVERVERAGLELTAVVEPVRPGLERPGLERQGPGTGDEGLAGDPGDEWLESYRFAVETMEEHSIRVMTTADLGRVAETARRELILS
jgi:hypothetical protein